MKIQDDVILVRRVLEGETDLFRVLVEKYQKTVFYLGLKFFHNYVDAEDFAQEVFLKIFKNLGSFQGRAGTGDEGKNPVYKDETGKDSSHRRVSFKGWLYKVAFHLAVNNYHLNKRRFLLTRELNNVERDEDMILDPSESVETRLIKKETAEEINAICKELPDIYNIVIKMHYYDGLKLTEIQEILDVPLNTVKSYIFRAKGLIKKKLLINGGKIIYGKEG
jgi:RNA polymerase sigma-70 factor (ECF subfamily)